MFTRKEKLVEEAQFIDCMFRLKNQDKQALQEIYRVYIGYIYSVVLQMVKNKEDAEDVTSEFFIKLWRLADAYQKGSNHKAWMTSVARNLAIDYMRKNNKEILIDEDSETYVENASDDNVESEVISDMSLNKALDTLKQSEREIVNLKIMGEFTFQEISKILKVPIGTVTWRYQNAIKKLRRCGYE